MSVRLMADVWDFGPDDATMTNVLVVLANSADDSGGNCFPGTALIARRTRYSERTVIRTIARLEADGWISVLQRGAGRPKGVNRWEKAGYMSQYRIHVEKLKSCHDVTVSNETEKVTPRQKKVTGATGKGDFDDNPPHPLLGVSVLDPSVNQEQLPLTPLASEGDAEAKRFEQEADEALERLCAKHGFEARRLRLKIRAVMVRRARTIGETPAAVAAAMDDAWMRVGRASSRLFRQPKAREFFCEDGMWLDPNRWPWDNREVREQRLQSEARAGSYSYTPQ